MKKNKKWEIIKEEDVSPSPWFPLFKHTVKLPNGKTVDDYYISKVGDVCMVVPITKRGEMVFVEQYKHGAGEVIVELPAGRIPEGHKPEEIAKKELEEETGYHTDKLLPLGFMFGEPSKDTYRVFGFLATGLEVRHEQMFDDNEDIEVLHIPLNKVDGKIKSGFLKGPDTIAFIKLVQLKFPELFK